MTGCFVHQSAVDSGAVNPPGLDSSSNLRTCNGDDDDERVANIRNSVNI